MSLKKNISDFIDKNKEEFWNALSIVSIVSASAVSIMQNMSSVAQRDFSLIALFLLIAIYSELQAYKEKQTKEIKKLEKQIWSWRVDWDGENK